MDKDIKIIELESKLKAEKEKRELFEKTLESRRNEPKCDRCTELEEEIARLEKEVADLEVKVEEARVANARGAGRKKALDDECAKAIYYQKTNGVPVTELAMMYQVSGAVIYNAIRRGKELKQLEKEKSLSK